MFENVFGKSSGLDYSMDFDYNMEKILRDDKKKTENKRY